jgi:hypothetical protein
VKRGFVCFLIVLWLTVCLVSSINAVGAETQTVWDIGYGLYGSGQQVIKTDDGGYAIAGETDGQLLFMKLDSTGDVEWTQTYGNGAFYSVTQTADGGYALAGTGDSINFVKTDSEGNLEWSKHYTKSDVPFHVQSAIQTSDGGYALAGWISSIFNSPQWDWTIKTDSHGNIVWNKTFGLRSGISSAREILQETDGGYVLAANGNVSKLDSEGNIQWTTNAVVANSLIKTSDGGYLLAAGNGGTLITLDAEGTKEWSNLYRFEGARWSFFHSATQASGGGYVIAGVTHPVYDGLGWVLKVDENGTVEGEVSFPPESGINNRIYSIIEADDGNYVFTGSKNAHNGEGLVWLAKIAPSAVIPEFSSLPPLLVMLVTVLVVASIYRRNLYKRNQRKKCD